MLSYRHAFHAGNHADILKHVTLSILLDHFTQKDKSFTYVDTHSGAGVYQLNSEEAQKTLEGKTGIEAVLEHLIDNNEKNSAIIVPRPLQPYIELCKAEYVGMRYPGSPEIAYQLSRVQDSLILSELHPTDFEFLESYMGGDKRVHIHKRNGYELLKAVSLPARSLVLIDPSYETDSDYKNVISAVQSLYKRCSTATIAVWYPLVGRRSLETSELKERLSLLVPLQEKYLCAEFSKNNTDSSQDTEYGMSGSGMVIINPSWQLDSKLTESLSWLAQLLHMRFNVQFEA